MSISAMQQTVQQLQAVSQTAGSQAGEQARPADNGGFAQELQQSLERINALQQDSAGKAEAFQYGDPNVSLNEVMVASQKASVAFEMGVQVRNRMAAAYQEIMNMQV